jgi:branched-chain amino acid transport system permease protein
MTAFTQALLSGLVIGSIYALIALGLSVVYSGTKVLNFAHGEFVMMGGLLAASAAMVHGLPTSVAVLGSTVIVVACAVAVDRFGLQLARDKSLLTYAMVTLGFAVIFRGAMQVTVGTDTMFLHAFGFIPDVRLGDLYLASQSIWVLGSLVVIVLALSLLFLRTRIGKGMRAASQNVRAAALCGIEPKRMSLLAFGIAALTGSLAGALIAPIGGISYHQGLFFGLKGFAAAILGGLGSPVGALIGGLFIGVLESMCSRFFSSEYKDAVALLTLLVLLILRPGGLLGRLEVKRV